MKIEWNRRRTGATLLGLLLLAAGVWAFRPRAMVVDVGEVAVGRFEQTVREDGRLRLRQRYLIAAPVAAELERPVLRVGDLVAANQVVAVLAPVAPQMIDARTRRVLAERVGSAEAAQIAAQAQVERARAAVAQAQLDAERSAKLAANDFVSAAARDTAALALRAQQKALDAAVAQANVADHALAEARAALTRAQAGEAGPGGERPGRWELRSPVTGRVMKLHQDSATPVPLGAPLLEIGDTAQLEAVVDLLSADALRVRPGAAVRLSLGPGAPLLAGTVQRVEPVAFTKVSALGIEEQRVNVIVDVDAARAAAAVGDGYRVDAEITVMERREALLVPAAALQRDGTRWSAFVVDGSRARLRTVEIGERHAEAAVVTGGLAKGDRVVLYPGAALRDGAPVQVRAAPQPQPVNGAAPAPQ